MSYIKEKLVRTVEEEIDVMICDRCKKKPKERAAQISFYFMNENSNNKWNGTNSNVYHICKHCIWDFQVDFMRISEQESEV